MKVFITGSTEFNDYDFFRQTCIDIISKMQYDRVVSCEHLKLLTTDNASGADRFTKKFSSYYLNKGIIIFQAHWNDLTEVPCIIKENNFGQYNANAGYNRNDRAIAYLEKEEDVAVIVFDMGDKHSKDIVRRSKKAGLKTYQVYCDPKKKIRTKVWN